MNKLFYKNLNHQWEVWRKSLCIDKPCAFLHWLGRWKKTNPRKQYLHSWNCPSILQFIIQSNWDSSLPPSLVPVNLHVTVSRIRTCRFLINPSRTGQLGVGLLYRHGMDLTHAPNTPTSPLYHPPKPSSHCKVLWNTGTTEEIPWNFVNNRIKSVCCAVRKYRR